MAARSISEARKLLDAVPQPAPEEIKRLSRPAAIFTLDQLDNHSVLKVMGERSNQQLRQRG